MKLYHFIYALFLGFSVALAYGAGYRLNTTASAPFGIWQIIDTEPVQHGSWVVICPPRNPLVSEFRHRGYIDAGYCAGGFEMLLKQVAALPGDHIKVSEEGIAVDGHLIAGTEPATVDGEGRPLVGLIVDQVVEKGDVWVYSARYRSVDSRYIGPFKLYAIDGVAKPILVGE